MCSRVNLTPLSDRYEGTRLSMRETFHEDEDDAMMEILRRAVNKSDTSSQGLQQRLFAAADEMGISRDAVLAAEYEYRRDQVLQDKLRQYDAERRKGFQIHLVSYASVNVFMAALNVMTYHEDNEIWFPYILLSWGIGIAIHAFLSLRKADPNDIEFKKWLIEHSTTGEL